MRALACLLTLSLSSCVEPVPERPPLGSEDEALDLGIVPIEVNDGPVGVWTDKPVGAYPSLNVDHGGTPSSPRYADAEAPDVATDGNTVYVAWREAYLWRLFPGEQPASMTDHEAIYVRLRDGSTWTRLGGDLNTVTSETGTASPSCGLASGNAGTPAIAAAGGVPHVAFIENVAAACTSPVRLRLFVKRWEAATGQWRALGEAPVPLTAGRSLPTYFSPTAPFTDKQKLVDLAMEGSTPVVAYVERSTTGAYFLMVKLWRAGSWVQVGGPVNHDSALAPQDPSLMFFGTGSARVPYLAWREGGNLYVKRVHVEPQVVFSTAALGPLSTWEFVGPATGRKRSSGGAVAALALAPGASAPVLAWSERNASSRVGSTGRPLSCTDVYVDWFDAATGQWRRWTGLTLLGDPGALTSACGAAAPFVDVGLALGSGGTYVLSAASEYDSGGLTPTGGRVKTQYWSTRYRAWRDLGNALDRWQDHPLFPDTTFPRAAIATTATGAPWVGWIRQHRVANDPYGVDRPAHQLHSAAFE